MKYVKKYVDKIKDHLNPGNNIIINFLTYEYQKLEGSDIDAELSYGEIVTLSFILNNVKYKIKKYDEQVGISSEFYEKYKFYVDGQQIKTSGGYDKLFYKCLEKTYTEFHDEMKKYNL